MYFHILYGSLLCYARFSKSLVNTSTENNHICLNILKNHSENFSLHNTVLQYNYVQICIAWIMLYVCNLYMYVLVSADIVYIKKNEFNNSIVTVYYQFSTKHQKG